MGESLFTNLAKQQLWCIFVIMLTASFTRQAQCQQPCQIQHCNAEYLALSSPPPSSSSSTAAHWGPTAPLLPLLDACEVLRGYSDCTKRTARRCRGNLLFHSALYRIRELFSQLNCSREGPGYPPPPPPGADPSRNSPLGPPGGATLCDYWRRVEGDVHSVRPDAEGYTGMNVHCGMFGDPHLRTVRDQFQTCKVEGAWPLLDNPYLTVQVTNTPVLRGLGPTGLTKITVIFKAFSGCTEQKVYQATADVDADGDDLPLAFTDGSRSSTDGHSLRVDAATSPGDGPVHVVQLRATHAGASILVRRTGRSLGFSARLPESSLGQERRGELGEEAAGGMQLCLHGCPRAELLQEYVWGGHGGRGGNPSTLVPLLPRPATPERGYSTERARLECSLLLPREDFYFQACVFDLQASADSGFSRAALWASQDLKTLFPSMPQQPRNLSRTAGVSGAQLRPNTRAATMGTLSVCLVLVLLFA
ncbi:repulsive guidance molecule A-like [Alosa sapidissima]|uniref:repulsive guidance molecule A-like n=1 Tax=Alosa sapidissima TaxID=34773 RepID=UPI001C08053F|nr:repulsive guidance molecule A-like [Alosa sapidissima]